MRDGQHVDTVNTTDVSVDEIISMMVGRTIFEEAPHVPADAEQQPYVLEVKGLSRGRAVQDITFGLRKGEILGVAGLVGAGRTELARLIFGADPKDAGETIVNGETVEIDNPAQAVEMGIAYLSEDRKRYGLTLGLDLETNIALASFDQVPQVAGARRHGQDEDGRRAAHRRARHQDAGHQPEGAQPLRWQPAEGRHRQVAHSRDGHPHLR